MISRGVAHRLGLRGSRGRSALLRAFSTGGADLAWRFDADFAMVLFLIGNRINFRTMSWGGCFLREGNAVAERPLK